MTDKHAWVLFAAAKLGSLHENSADGAAKIAASCADALLKEMQQRELQDEETMAVKIDQFDDMCQVQVSFDDDITEYDSERERYSLRTVDIGR